MTKDADSGASNNYKGKMLALLPLPGHPLQARYHGPYVVECKMGSVDYVITIPDCQS